ncbi:DUF354 domain-containing protein [Candidatus Latescibacterota bacterium]
MRIIVDITHQSNIHSFKHAIKNWINHGHTVIVTSRDKEVLVPLLNAAGITHMLLGRSASSVPGLLGELIARCVKLFRIVRREKPDVITSFGGPFSAPVGRLAGVPTVTFYDTEHAWVSNLIAYSTTHYLVLPSSYKNPPKRRTIFFAGCKELAYLRPEYFTPDPGIRERLGLAEGDRFAIIRFVSRRVSHDFGHRGLRDEDKIHAVEAFLPYARVFISSEVPLPGDLASYQFPLPPEEMHHALALADMLYGESATMASECAVLGTPAIYLDFTGRGYTDKQEEKYGLVHNFSLSQKDIAESIRTGIAILTAPEGKRPWKEKRDRLLGDTIDLTALITELVERVGRGEPEEDIYRRFGPLAGS